MTRGAHRPRNLPPRPGDFPYWRIAEFIRGEGWSERAYPFNLPAVRRTDQIGFHPKVTFFVGENGSGKSTLVEALAVAWGFNAEGGSTSFNFATRGSHSPLHQFIRPVRGHLRPLDGFFLRAESFYNAATYVEEISRDGRPISGYGDRGLHEQSHGESFFALFQERFRGDGLYILDEPEAALSPARQLSFLTRLHELVRARSQFIIATHSPIILAYPDADIWRVSDFGLEKVDYEDTEAYQTTRAFLLHRETMLRTLLED